MPDSTPGMSGAWGGPLNPRPLALSCSGLGRTGQSQVSDTETGHGRFGAEILGTCFSKVASIDDVISAVLPTKRCFTTKHSSVCVYIYIYIYVHSHMLYVYIVICIYVFRSYSFVTYSMFAWIL